MGCQVTLQRATKYYVFYCRRGGGRERGRGERCGVTASLLRLHGEKRLQPAVGEQRMRLHHSSPRPRACRDDRVFCRRILPLHRRAACCPSAPRTATDCGCGCGSCSCSTVSARRSPMPASRDSFSFCTSASTDSVCSSFVFSARLSAANSVAQACGGGMRGALY